MFPPLQQDFFTSPFSDSNYKMSTEFQILYGDSRKYKKSYWCTQCHLVAKTKFTKLEREFKGKGGIYAQLSLRLDFHSSSGFFVCEALLFKLNYE